MTVAVVTGGTRGIGAALSARLVELGHDVIAVATSHPENPPPGATVRICDVTREESVDQLFAAIGPVDILINNAGISSSSPFVSTTTTDWNHSLAVNATGPFLCTRAVLGAMVAQGSGRIVTVASTAALEGAKYIAAYAASKHAVLGLMRVLVAEVAGTGVTANTVCPTYVRTDMTTSTIVNIAERTGCTPADAEAKLAAHTPHHRIIEVDEVVDAVISLIESDHNGQEVLLDGAPQ